MKEVTPLSVLLQIKRHCQVTLPVSIREKLGLGEGDFVEAEIDKGRILLKPKKMIDAEQSWFWTKKRQRREKEAEKAIRRGELVGPFKNINEALKALKGK